MAEKTTRIGVLASGGGTTFEAVQCAINEGEIQGIDIDVVVCNNGPENPDAGVWQRAQRLGIDIVHISNKTQPECTLPEVDGKPIEGTISFEASQRLLELADHKGLHMFVALGYMKKVIGKVLEGVPIANTHPGPLPETAGEYGTGVQERAMRLGLSRSGPTFHWMDTRLDERGLPTYDTGEKIDHQPVDITEAMQQEWAQQGTVELLKKEVMRVEKLMVPRWIVRAAGQL